MPCPVLRGPPLFPSNSCLDWVFLFVTAFVGLHYGSGLLAGSWDWVRAALGGADCFAAAKLLDLVRQSAPSASCRGFRL